MDAWLSTWEQAEQAVRYRKIVCEGPMGKTVIADTLFAEYWKTRFQRKGESFVAAVMNGILPMMAEPVGIRNSDDQVSRSEFISPPPMGIPETASPASSETVNLGSPSLTPPPVSSATVVLSLSWASPIIPTALANFTTTKIPPAPSTLPSFPGQSRLTPGQLASWDPSWCYL